MSKLLQWFCLMYKLFNFQGLFHAFFIKRSSATGQAALHPTLMKIYRGRPTILGDTRITDNNNYKVLSCCCCSKHCCLPDIIQIAKALLHIKRRLLNFWNIQNTLVVPFEDDTTRPRLSTSFRAKSILLRHLLIQCMCGACPAAYVALGVVYQKSKKSTSGLSS